MDPKVAAILKWAVAALIGLLAYVVISKHFKTEGQKTAVVAEMQAIASEATFYRAVSDRDARTAFLRSIALLHRAGELDMQPVEVFNRVFDRKDGKAVDDGSFEGYPTREKLAREAITRGYQHAAQLGLLAGRDEIAALAAGEMPTGGTRTVITCIIDPQLAPGLEKVIANFELRPFDNQNAAPDDVQIAAARRLAGELSLAGIIDRQTEQRIHDHLRPDPKKAAAKAAEKPAPEPAEEPAPEPEPTPAPEPAPEPEATPDPFAEPTEELAPEAVE